MFRILSIVSMFLFALCLAGTAFAQDSDHGGLVYGFSGEPIPAYSLAQMYEEPEDHVLGRVLTDVGFDLLYTGAVVGLTELAMMDSCEGEECMGNLFSLIFGGIGLALAPALAVHTSHAIWGGDGSIGWTYGGALIGGALGLSIGALVANHGSSDDYEKSADDAANGLVTMAILIPVGALIGAVVGYEVSNKVNRDARQNAYFSVSKIYPVLELSEERKSFGVGIEF